MLFDRIHQHHPPDSPVRFGEGASRQRGNVRRREQVKILWDVDLGDLLALFFVEGFQRLVLGEFSNVAQERHFAGLTFRRSGKYVVDGDDLADDVFGSVVPPNGRANRFDLAEVVRQHDGGRGPATEQLFHALVELTGILGALQVGVQLAEVVFEGRAREVQQTHATEEGQGDGHDGDAARVAVDA